MENAHDETNQHSTDLTSAEDWQFDPDCTLILYGLHGRNHKGLLKKFQAVGKVIFWQPVVQFDTAIVAYETHELALEAKNTISDEKVLFCTEDTTIPSNSLLLPPRMRNFMTSPPPSPPEDWAPHGEDINRIAFRDLEAKTQEDGTVQLLPRTITSPSIIMTPDAFNIEK